MATFLCFGFWLGKSEPLHACHVDNPICLEEPRVTYIYIYIHIVVVIVYLFDSEGRK